MLIFDIVTIFPGIFDGFLKESFIKKAQEKKKIEIKIWNLRDFAKDKHKTVDDRPYGGGLGMVLKVEPIYFATEKIKKLRKAPPKKRKIILFSPRGVQFDQKMAYSFSKLKHLILICGRYEGVDERVAKYIADISLSLGPFVLMGGEVAAMALIESVIRLVPGVLGKSEQLLEERITKEKGFLEYAQYTRPAVFCPKKGVSWKVPKVLLSGDHKKIKEWRQKHKKEIV